MEDFFQPELSSIEEEISDEDEENQLVEYKEDKIEKLFCINNNLFKPQILLEEKKSEKSSYLKDDHDNLPNLLDNEDVVENEEVEYIYCMKDKLNPSNDPNGLRCCNNISSSGISSSDGISPIGSELTNDDDGNQASNSVEKSPTIFKDDTTVMVEYLDTVEDVLEFVEVDGCTVECNHCNNNVVEKSKQIVHNGKYVAHKEEIVEFEETDVVENTEKIVEKSFGLVEFDMVDTVRDDPNLADSNSVDLVDLTLRDNEVDVSSDNEIDNGKDIVLKQNVDLERSLSMEVDNTQNEQQQQQQQQQDVGLPRKRKISAEISKRVF